MKLSDKTWNDKIKSSQFSFNGHLYKTGTSCSFLSFSVIFTSVNNRGTTDTRAAVFFRENTSTQKCRS